MTKPTVHEMEQARKAERSMRASRRRRIGIIKFRQSRKARRQAVHSEVAARGTEWRLTTYRNQNRINGVRGTAGDGLTPRQRRRVAHKENAARAER